MGTSGPSACVNYGWDLGTDPKQGPEGGGGSLSESPSGSAPEGKTKQLKKKKKKEEKTQQPQNPKTQRISRSQFLSLLYPSFSCPGWQAKLGASLSEKNFIRPWWGGEGAGVLRCLLPMEGQGGQVLCAEAGLWGSGLALSVKCCIRVFCCWRFCVVIAIVFKYMAGIGSAGGEGQKSSICF